MVLTSSSDFGWLDGNKEQRLKDSCVMVLLRDQLF